MPVVLITGGNGRTARYVIEEFLSHPNCPDLRVLVRDEGQAPLQKAFPLLTQPPHAIAVADCLDERTLTPMFQNVTVIVHDGPAVHQQDLGAAIAIIDAAKKANVQHFVLCSVLHPMRTKLATHKFKLHSEEYLVESRLNYTILQPTNYMQNVPLSHVLRTGKIPLAYSDTVEQGFIDLRDFAQLLRSVVFNMESHRFATYELVSENLTYRAVAEVLQELMHRDVDCDVIPSKTYLAMMKDGMNVQSEFSEDAMERLMLYHNRWGLIGNSNVLRWLLGHEPRTWRQYAAEMLQKI